MPSSEYEPPSPNVTSLDSAQPEPDDDTLAELDRISFSEILDEDPRPSFVLSLDADAVVTHNIRPIFCNASLRQHDRLLRSIVCVLPNHDGKGFRHWATKAITLEDAPTFTLEYYGLCWTQWTVRGRWRIISGDAFFRSTKDPEKTSRSKPSQHDTAKDLELEDSGCFGKEHTPAVAHFTKTTPPENAPKLETASDSSSAKIRHSISRTGSALRLSPPDEFVMVDWTVPHPTGTISDHIAYTRGIDWANTPIGPMETW